MRILSFVAHPRAHSVNSTRQHGITTAALESRLALAAVRHCAVGVPCQLRASRLAAFATMPHLRRRSSRLGASSWPSPAEASPAAAAAASACCRALRG